jgi:hypothetical protein
MSSGVIYYNVGQACVVRLLVSIYSLKQHYQGPITIISEGSESDLLCTKVANVMQVDIKQASFNTDGPKNHPFLAKTKIHQAAPYDYNVFLDSDTLVVGKIDELFNSAPFTITRMADWSTNGPKISRRIENWSNVCPDLVKPALAYEKAINTGIFAFRRDAPIFNEWYDLTLKNRDTFIPDEISCQLLLPKYLHNLLDCRFNWSCKYGPEIEDIRIIHYHGRKHCRPGLPFNADKWIKVYNEVVAQNLADIRTWQPAGDRMLRKYLEAQTCTT